MSTIFDETVETNGGGMCNSTSDYSLEDIYQAFKERLLKEGIADKTAVDYQRTSINSLDARMSKHEIEIEGIPEGWEVVAIRGPNLGEQFLGPILSDGNFQINTCKGFIGSDPHVIVRRKVRKYDWSKTLLEVLVTTNNIFFIKRGDLDFDAPPPPTIAIGAALGARGPAILATCWQPNIHGKCPVDPEASIVRIQGGSEHGDLAGMMDWQRVKAWQFVRLAEGVEW